ncbi:hypothetical protein [Pseudomonas viridiflava]|uniref:hypothetical protein n=1 Tax=Pseudomonas viridiflava TaxID=33069 RepID=UPI001F13E81A|nr:hypothetical protein [Pseudomonas viridiflava]
MQKHGRSSRSSRRSSNRSNAKVFISGIPCGFQYVLIIAHTSPRCQHLFLKINQENFDLLASALDAFTRCHLTRHLGSILTVADTPMNHYDEALDAFVTDHKASIAFLFGTPKSHVSKDDLKSMLEYTIGIQLQNSFEYKGSFGKDLLHELQLIPRHKRSAAVAQKALEHAEFKQVQNKTLDMVKAADKARNPLSEHLNNWRKMRMRREMRELSQSALIVEKQTRLLTLALDRYRHSPSATNKHIVSTAVMGLNRALVKSHSRARIAGAWAIRAGFHSQSAGQALERLYFGRARRLEKSTMKLDHWLEQNDFKVRVSPGIARRRNIMEIELSRAIDQDASTPLMRYAGRHLPHRELEIEHAR